MKTYIVNVRRCDIEIHRDTDGKFIIPGHIKGKGTNLKPAHEPIVLARKPLIGTVVDNVLAHGTGGINIDACRIEPVTVDGGSLATNPHLRTHIKGGNGGHIIRSEKERRVITPNVSGRWPANVLLSHHSDCKVIDDVYECHPDCPYNFFPHTKSGTLTPAMNVKPSSGWSGGSQANRVKSSFQSNAGSAARFFYCAKTSRFDRNEGLEVEATLSKTETKNNHPTVKPVDLMSYLCRLVTPPNGIILDPFMGSGSTGKAAMLEGFRFIGVEIDEQFFDIARKRVRHAYNT